MFAVRDKVGDYEIVAKLKAGGMATLFLGKRTGASGFSRHVAIKVVHEHLASDATFVRMFVDEALLSSKIHHPNVVHVEELRQINGRHFLVMEYVHGCSLSQLMNALRRRSRTLRPELATYIAVKVAEGLHAAHTATDASGMPLGVVHRDVSPQNVLLAFRGHVKLIDFGVAKAAGRAQQTTGGSLKGKIRYMAPEQAFGREVDSRTDVYALGVVLWEMLTGRKAFSAPNELALLELVRNPQLEPARSHNEAIPEALDEVIQRALAKEPADRFQSAQTMRKALAKALPSALALDASDLEQLLAAVMDDAIAAQGRQLPESVSGVMQKPPAAPAEEIVATLTVSAAGISGATEPEIPDVPEAVHEVAATVVTPPPGPAPSLVETSHPPPARAAWVVPAAVVGALAVVGLAGAGVYVATRPADGITATELGEGSPEAPADPASTGPATTAVEPSASGAADPDPGDTPSQRPDGVGAGDVSTGEDAPASAEPATARAEERADPGAEVEAVTPVATDSRDEPAAEPAPRRRRPRRRGRPTQPAGEDVGGVLLTDEF